MNRQLLIFDLDGTLADTRKDLMEAVNHVRRRFDLSPLSLETVTGYVGDGINKLLERALPNISPETLPQARAYFDEYYREHVVDHTRLYPGVAEMLDALNGHPCAVLSNKAQEYTEEIVERLGIRPYFRLVLGGRADFPRKPAPDALRYIMKKMEATPAATLMIGDTKNDILAGKAAGVVTVAVTYGFRSREQLAPYQPDYMIDHPGELVAVVEGEK